MLMLFYSLLGGYFVLLSFLNSAYSILVQTVSKSILSYSDISKIIITSVLLSFCILLSKFSLFHARLVMKNSTTIESLENNYNYCYSISVYRNFIQVFGKNPWIWMIPVYGRSGKPVGDGILWPMLEHQYSDSDVNVESDPNRENSFKPMNAFNSPDAWPPERKIESPSHIAKSPSDIETDISMIKLNSRLSPDKSLIV
jgi:hypothetical protein